jgi:hypothetical protein
MVRVKLNVDSRYHVIKCIRMLIPYSVSVPHSYYSGHRVINALLNNTSRGNDGLGVVGGGSGGTPVVTGSGGVQTINGDAIFKVKGHATVIAGKTTVVSNNVANKDGVNADASASMSSALESSQSQSRKADSSNGGKTSGSHDGSAHATSGSSINRLQLGSDSSSSNHNGNSGTLIVNVGTSGSIESVEEPSSSNPQSASPSSLMFNNTLSDSGTAHKLAGMSGKCQSCNCIATCDAVQAGFSGSRTIDGLGGTETLTDKLDRLVSWIFCSRYW